MDKLWLNQYPSSVPHTVDLERYSSLNELLSDAFTQFQTRISFTSMGTHMRFGELEKKSCYFASYLQQLHLPKGSRVAIMLPNVLQYPIALMGILRAGLVVVNTNPLYTADELVHQLRDAQVETIVILSKFVAVLEKARPRIPSLKHIIVSDIGDCFPFFKRHAFNFVVKHIIDRKLTYKKLPQANSFLAVLEQGQHYPFRPVACQPDDLAFLQYTGGTTGLSKGAMLTHRNIVAAVLQSAAWISPKQFDHTDLIITALPLYHIFSLTANCFTFFHLGVQNVLIIDARDTKHLLKQIHATPPTAITGVNTLFVSFLNHPNFNPIDFSRLKIALSGGMALHLAVAEKWRKLTGNPIIEAYGLTEASPGVTINLLTQDTHQGSIGLPLPSTEISIRDASGKECALGETGELCIRGPQVMLGYWQQSEETAKVFWPDHYLRTGDSARVDEQGFIYLIDRIKDMIIVSGFNVYPNEVEQVIAQMPQVREVGVIGVYSSSGNEIIKACVVSRDPSLTSEQVIAYCHEHLTGYKIPKIVAFYPELPKTNVGKILRRMLK